MFLLFNMTKTLLTYVYYCELVYDKKTISHAAVSIIFLEFKLVVETK